jgi:hypothetical protein
MRARKQKILKSAWETGTAGCKTYQNNNPHCYFFRASAFLLSAGGPTEKLHRYRLRLLTRVTGEACGIAIDAQFLGAAGAELVLGQHA